MENPNDRIYRNLISILKLFQNRPYHLAKYLIENEAFTEEFLNKILNNKKLNNLNEDDDSKNQLQAIYFIDISHMKDYLNSLTDDSIDNTIDDEIKLNQKLEIFLKEEKYEDAARIRDYMKKNNIQIKKT